MLSPARKASAKQMARDAVVVLIQDCSDAEVEALSNVDVLDILSTMREELGVVIRAYAAEMEGNL